MADGSVNHRAWRRWKAQDDGCRRWTRWRESGSEGFATSYCWDIHHAGEAQVVRVQRYAGPRQSGL